MDEFINNLLDTWRAKGKFGLTLPFIIGALRLKSFVEGSAAESFHSTLKELLASNITFRLAYCDKADDLILAPVQSSPAGCRRISSNGKSTSLWVQHDLVTGDSADSSDLAEVLWERYCADFEAERYSCTKGKYHPFTKDDLALIEVAFNKNA